MSYIRSISCSFIPCILLLYACGHKLGNNLEPIPIWENKKADSVTFRVTVQTMNGTYLYGEYVNLALSLDSLNKGTLVRRTMTNSLGIAEFRRLYPRVYYYNCFVTNELGTFFGSGHASLPPYAIRDTILVVY